MQFARVAPTLFVAFICLATLCGFVFKGQRATKLQKMAAHAAGTGTELADEDAAVLQFPKGVFVVLKENLSALNNT